MVSITDKLLWKYLIDRIMQHVPINGFIDDETMQMTEFQVTMQVKNILADNPGLCEYFNIHYFVNISDIHSLDFTLRLGKHCDERFIHIHVHDPNYERRIL